MRCLQAVCGFTFYSVLLLPTKFRLCTQMPKTSFPYLDCYNNSTLSLNHETLITYRLAESYILSCLSD